MIVLPLTNGIVLVISLLKLPTINLLISNQVSSATKKLPLLSLNNHVVMVMEDVEVVMASMLGIIAKVKVANCPVQRITLVVRSKIRCNSRVSS